MDKRSWPWKKKLSDKSVAEKSVTSPDSDSQADQEINKKPKYVQISVESYSHLTGLENQVKSYEDQVKNLEDKVEQLNEKLSAADTEMINKEILVKQHSKVAEEAVSGWEKAEAEAAALKGHLESVTLLKLTAEDRASHLDGALKECMRQIRNLKEEHEENLNEVVLIQTKQFEKMKLDFEAEMANLDQELRRSAAENAALSRSLQERSNTLVKISQEKSQAEAEIELLKSNIDSCERDIHSLKYEMHLLTKEVEIRNEEKNMCARSAEVANKQNLEGVKIIAKLEAECQKLRGLVRKKLPGPAAVAQMKLEVESMGRDYGDTRVRRSPGKPPSPHSHQFSEFSLDHMQKFQKENDFLTERLVAMEEETKMLKEALTMRNNELQASRNMCAKTINKLQSLESQVQTSNQLTSPLKANIVVPSEGFLSHSASSPPSFTSVSEDGNDDQESIAGSWATILVSDKPRRRDSASHLELMDDFLEMEKLACLSNDQNGTVSLPNQETAKEVANNSGLHPLVKTESDVVSNDVAHAVDLVVEDPQSTSLKNLQSRISVLLDSMPEDADVDKILDEIKRSVQKTSVNKTVSGETEVTPEKEITLSENSKPAYGASSLLSEDLAQAISEVHDFILVLEKDAISLQRLSPNEDGLSHRIQNFSLTLDSVIQGKTSLIEFVLDLSHVLNKANELHINVLGFKNNESETNSSDCIDKAALPENKLVQESVDQYTNGCAHFSDPDIPHDGNYIPVVEANGKCDELEELKQEKEELVMALARKNENFETTIAELQETEKLLEEAKSQLTSALKTNGLIETQLKCMAESYRSLETRADELQTEVNLLQENIENLEGELKKEKNSHQEALIKCNDLEEQLKSIATSDQTNQEKDIAAASEKLAEFQETVFLLGKQLNSLRPQADITGSPLNDRVVKGNHIPVEDPSTSEMSLRDYDQMENSQRLGGESPLNGYNPLFSPSNGDISTPSKSPINLNHQKYRPTKSGSSSLEKNSRGFSRFFSSKPKNGH